jgi:cytochrome b pre-mRNA-processing protein 3
LALTLVVGRKLSTSGLAAGFGADLPFYRNTIRDAARYAYALVVEQSRRLEFFTALGVPDTLDGRFELICVHAFLYLRRLKGEAAPAASLAQSFVDTMIADFDRSLREIGTGDLGVGRQVKRMAEAFYGRIRAYEDGLAGDDPAFCAALARNLYGTATATQAQLAQMVGYLRREVVSLAAQPTAPLLAGAVAFGSP